MTAKNARYRCSRLSISLSVAMATMFAPSQLLAADLLAAAPSSAANLGLSMPDDASAAPDTGNELYLEAVLNLAPTGQLARFVQIDDRFYASAATLRELGLQWSGSGTAAGLLALDTIPGLILNYDLRGQQSGDTGTLAGWSELRLFGLGPGIWSNTWDTRLLTGHVASDAARHDSVRLDTSWQLDFPESMTTLSLGDGVTGATSWSRATRIGGLHLGSDFSLQPYRITAPLAAFAGEAALPSTVDLFINGIKQSSQQVAPGQFLLNSAPTLSGAGAAQVVITDINGLSRTVDVPLYGTSSLLGAGLSDWSLDIGWVRRDYGLKSFSYAEQPMESFSLRHGLSDTLTVETHAETDDSVQMFGFGGVWLPGARSGVFNGSWARSASADFGTGEQHAFGYQWNGGGFNFSAETTRRSAGFHDVASLEGSTLAPRTDQAFVGFSTPLGQWNTGYVHQANPDGSDSRYATLSWSKQFAHLNNVYFSLSRDLAQGGNTAYLMWSVALDRRTQLSASLRRDGDAQSLAVQAGRTLDSDRGGWGWQAQASRDDAGSHTSQAQLDWLGDYGGGNIGAADFDGTNSYWAEASGGLLWMAGHVRPMRQADNAFAMVSTAGVAGVPVKLENRLIGQTDANGLLLVDRLNPWQSNKLSIDTRALPADMRIDSDELHAVPSGRSGVLAQFPLKRTLSVQVGVVDPAGKPLPLGSPVWTDDAAADAAPLTVVGNDSLLYLQDPPAHARLRIRTDAGACMLELPDLPQQSGFTELDGVVCR